MKWKHVKLGVAYTGARQTLFHALYVTRAYFIVAHRSTPWEINRAREDAQWKLMH